MTNFEKELTKAYLENEQDGIKAVEIALQNVIEEQYPTKCWWEVCNVSIFNELLAGTKPYILVDKIIEACN